MSAKPCIGIVTHEDPDIDDLVAIRILKEVGNDHFPGLAQAGIILDSNRDLRGKLRQTLETEGYILVGVYGSRFDEHAYEGLPKKEGECAASLAAKYLGVQDEARYKRIVEYAMLRNYSAANTTEFELAPLAKLAFRHRPKDTAEKSEKAAADVMFAVNYLLCAAMSNECCLAEKTQHTGAVSLSMDNIIAEWILRKFGTRTFQFDPYRTKHKGAEDSSSLYAAEDCKVVNQAALQRILKYAHVNQMADTRRTDTRFDLAALVRLAQRHFCVGNAGEQNKVLRDIKEATFTLLDGMYWKEHNFHVLCKNDRFSKNTNEAWLRVPDGDQGVLIVSVLSKNTEIQKYCRSEDGGRAAIVIKRDPQTGNTQVFTDQRYGLTLKYVALRLRTEERRLKNFKNGLDQDALMIEGVVEGADEWFYDTNGKQLLNGSLTTDRPPTRISRDVIERIVLAGAQQEFDEMRMPIATSTRRTQVQRH